MVGSATRKMLKTKGYENIFFREHSKLELKDNDAVLSYFRKNKFDVVINAAAKVGGILTNQNNPYDFISENITIQSNLIESSRLTGVNKFIFLGSSCAYPKFAKQPIKEECLLSGSLEPTNQYYAIAKIAGVMSCMAVKKQYGMNAISLMPTNLYGKNDNFDLNTSHVLPALIRKFHDAKINNNSNVGLWGSGEPLREFLHVKDLASAIVFCLENNLQDNIYNIGYGEEFSIKKLALLIQQIVGHTGTISWDKTKPDGTPRKLLDSSKILKSGWKAKISLEEGIKEVYEYYKMERSLH